MRESREEAPLRVHPSQYGLPSMGMLNRGKEEEGRMKKGEELVSPLWYPSHVFALCVTVCPLLFYSHSVVPGGLEVRSYMTLEIPGIFLISFTIFNTTCEKEKKPKTSKISLPALGRVRAARLNRRVTSSGIWLPGVAGMPVMKSLVMKVRITTERLQDGCFCSGSRSKCRGVRMMGIWLILPE